MSKAQAASSDSQLGCDGLFVIDKPEGMSSFDIVAKIRRWIRPRKIGHCGTLDPFATGVLLICLNHATRVSDQLLDQDKAYRFKVRFGIETDTLDKTGQVVGTSEGPARSGEEIESVLDLFRGSYLQEVPRYSAVKVQGRRLYKLSRSGIDVEALPSREVHIRSLKLLDLSWPEASIEALCSKGTYIRQLAADIGRKLGCGAHVSELRRFRSGHFGLEQAVSIDELDEAVSKGRWKEKLLPVSDALAHLPSVLMEDEATLKRLIEGQMDPEWEMEYRSRFAAQEQPVRLLTKRNHLAALWWPHPAPGQSHRLRVFGPEPEQ